MSNRKGLRYEDQALRHLQSRGLRLLQHNYSCRWGEIDLIMQDGESICFVEVKFRKSMTCGGAMNSITLGKRGKIIKTALFYIAAHRQLAKFPLRFDALLIQRQADGSDRIEWIRNAFYAE